MWGYGAIRSQILRSLWKGIWRRHRRGIPATQSGSRTHSTAGNPMVGFSRLERHWRSRGVGSGKHAVSSFAGESRESPHWLASSLSFFHWSSGSAEGWCRSGCRLGIAEPRTMGTDCGHCSGIHRAVQHSIWNRAGNLHPVGPVAVGIRIGVSGAIPSYAGVIVNSRLRPHTKGLV